MELRLGYLGIRGDKLAWQSFASDVYGLQSMPGDELVLRADQKDWRIKVSQDDGPPLRYVGLELDSPAELDALAERLRAHGHDAVFDGSLARERQVNTLLRVFDPDGTPLEFFVGAMEALEPFASPLGVRFVTGRAGLGHLLLSVSDVERSLAFYKDVVGLQRSDVLEMGGGMEAHFLNGGYRHHVIALGALPGLVGLHHMFVEVESIAEVGLAWDRVQARNIPIVSKIGQHANDPALSFYVESPSGFAFEYGTGSLIVDREKWTETRWKTPLLWGGGQG